MSAQKQFEFENTEAQFLACSDSKLDQLNSITNEGGRNYHNASKTTPLKAYPQNASSNKFVSNKQHQIMKGVLRSQQPKKYNKGL